MYEQIDLGQMYGLQGCLQETKTPVRPQMDAGVRLDNQNACAAAGANRQIMPLQGGMPMQTEISANMPPVRIPLTDAPEMAVTQRDGRIMLDCERYPYLNSFIRTQIGRRVKADFLIGGTSIITKDGYIVGVGSDYILINEVEGKTITAGEFSQLKFISFSYGV